MEKKSIYLLVVALSFIVMIIMYAVIDYETVYVEHRALFTFLNFAGLLFLMIPTVLYTYFKWNDLKYNKGFIIMSSGFITMIIMIVWVFIYVLNNPDIAYLNLSVGLYYGIVVAIIITFFVGAIVSYLDVSSSSRDKWMMIVWAFSLSFFVISRLKNFYPLHSLSGDENYIFLSNFAFSFRFSTIRYELFSRLSTFLVFLGFIASVVTKYISFSQPQKTTEKSVFEKDIL